MRNLANAGRELTALYNQNQELFQQNRELKDEIESSDERVRQLTKIIKT